MNQEGTLGSRIRELRKEYPMTLEELGNKVGVTHAFLSRVENNKVKPNDELLQKLASILDYNDSNDYLNEFRMLSGTFDNIDKNNPYYNELKASGRLEINNYDIRNVKKDKIVEKPYYKLNYLFENDFKVFYDIKTSILGEKIATIEIPYNILISIYKDINLRIIDLIKTNPELLTSVSNPEVLDEYNNNRKIQREKIFKYLQYINPNDDFEEFMREIFNDEDIL
ncbi:helix-turn-helix domain-containing protein [Staphylococcus hominis]|uniref:helix-turn-helix domain-containing protein n=1 Tax=Staphylococcus hominis TaxID=1290 RepID=UPI0012DE2F09|nr:helix-turn-helix transcriptional regulator [Staphylococcus hominis]MDS3851543.1 helix-turn-helix transcriptional regulator [Staphylococcus hominis]QGR76870.1 helix-turn-helix domain-containing protein [Staphylococcus hominis]